MKRKFLIYGSSLLLLFLLIILYLYWTNREKKEPIVPEVSLCNEQADEHAQEIMNYLASVYGKQFISGQHCSDKFKQNELLAIQTETGKLPALVSYDFMRYSTSFSLTKERSTAVDWAIEEGKSGAIISFCWHWNAPKQYVTENIYGAYRTENTDINLDQIMNGNDEEGYQLLLEDMDHVAKQLKRLQEAGIPVLWRPLHEASGGWFWWGNCEPESYIKLYRLMYERFTKQWELNHLIWVWNGQDVAWYPGDDVVDIIGEDIYSEREDDSSHVQSFKKANAYTKSHKMIALTEAAPIFVPEKAMDDGAYWSFFCLWGGRCTCIAEDQPVFSEEYMTKERLQEVYHSDLVITREDLPAWTWSS